MSHIGRRQRELNKRDPHLLLAKLDIAVFVSANRDNLLRDALRDIGKEPVVHLCTWIMHNDTPQRIGPELPRDYVPSIQQPLIFQAFGNLEYPTSLVLTEDDYFDFLIAVTRNEAMNAVSIPAPVSSALSGSGLLLLGFQPEDWDFLAALRDPEAARKRVGRPMLTLGGADQPD